MTVKQRQMQQLRLHQEAKLPEKAMVLCAGKGTRMMPLTAEKPKALVEMAGKPILERTLTRCKSAGIKDVVLNMHYKPDALRNFVDGWSGKPKLHISDETDALLDTGGGIQHALPLLGEKRFFVINCDVMWRDGLSNSLGHLARHWNGKKMDVLLLLVRVVGAVGIGDRGDFAFASDGQVRWPKERRVSANAYAGIQLIHPRAFQGAPGGAYSVRDIWTRAMEAGRVHGCLHEGPWAHVGTPQSIKSAETLLGYTKG